MSEHELGRIVAAHTQADHGSDVANSRHLDPERPPLAVIQALEHREFEDHPDYGIGPAFIATVEIGEAFSLEPGAVNHGPLFDDKVAFTDCECLDCQSTRLSYDRVAWTGECKHGCGSRYVTAWELEDHEKHCHEQTRRLAQEALARMDQHLPPGPAERKGMPVATGFIDYFPDAVAAVATLSRIGNDQHNPGSPLHWDRSKSGDESDALMRHFLDRGQFDTDGVRHSVKVAWRAMALLQKEIEAAKARLEPVFK